MRNEDIVRRGFFFLGLTNFLFFFHRGQFNKTMKKKKETKLKLQNTVSVRRRTGETVKPKSIAFPRQRQTEHLWNKCRTESEMGTPTRKPS